MLMGSGGDANALLPGIPGKRCAHCNTQTTPLWRNGPGGAKTLCNACGVRDNRRHAKTRGAASRPRPRKAEPSIAATTARAKKRSQMNLDGDGLGGDGEGGRRSARWNAGLLTKRAKAESLDAEQRRAQKRRTGYSSLDAHDQPGADVGPDGTIWVPTTREVAGYEHDARGGFVPSTEYVAARPATPAGRFAPGGAAPMYDATAADKAWLTEVNTDRAPGAELRERALEHLFDVFEEASWHSGSVPDSASAAYELLGYGGASVAEAEAAVKHGLAYDPSTLLDFVDDDDHVLSNGLAMHAETWDAVDPLSTTTTRGAVKSNKSEQSFLSDRSYTPPLTPDGSIEQGPGGFARAVSASVSVDGFGSSPGSAPSRDDTDLDASENGSDNGDGSVFGGDASGNGKSSDLAAAGLVMGGKRATRASALATTTKPKAGPLKVNKGTSELKERVSDGDETMAKARNGKGGTKEGAVLQKKNSKTTLVQQAVTKGKEPRRATRASAKDSSPTLHDAERVFCRYKKLRAANGGAALRSRFQRPAPPQLRARALLGGMSAGVGYAEDEQEAANVMAAAAAGEYQFVLGFEGVQRQQRERAARGEAIKEASRRRRRRACFNPAASKRRRKQQAALEIAIEAPLRITHDASEMLFVGTDLKASASGSVEHQIGDHQATPTTDEPVVHSEWESDDDIPLKELADREVSPDLTLADIAAQHAEAETRLSAKRLAAKADTAAKAKAAAAAKAEADVEHPSVMAKVASAASCVLSRFIGTAKPVAVEAFQMDSPSTPRKRRTPRARRVKTEA